MTAGKLKHPINADGKVMRNVTMIETTEIAVDEDTSRLPSFYRALAVSAGDEIEKTYKRIPPATIGIDDSTAPTVKLKVKIPVDTDEKIVQRAFGDDGEWRRISTNETTWSGWIKQTDTSNTAFAKIEAASAVTPSAMAAGDRTNMFPDDGFVDSAFYSGDPFTLPTSTFTAPLSANMLQLPAVSGRTATVYSDWFECPEATPIFCKIATSFVSGGAPRLYLERANNAGTVLLTEEITNAITLTGDTSATANVCKARLRFDNTSGGGLGSIARFGNIEIRKATYLGQFGTLVREDRATVVRDSNLLTGSKSTGYTAATGTADKTAFATYTAPTVSNPPTQAEMQALANHVQVLSRQLMALKNDSITRAVVGS